MGGSLAWSSLVWFGWLLFVCNLPGICVVTDRYPRWVAVLSRGILTRHVLLWNLGFYFWLVLCMRAMYLVCKLVRFELVFSCLFETLRDGSVEETDSHIAAMK